MLGPKYSAPPPDLRIVPIENIHPHEEYDPQRADPLMERLKQAIYLTNPPIVTEIENGQYIVLDGANRYHAFLNLSYKRLLVQVVHYESEFVDLGVWQHIISGWEENAFVQQLHQLAHIKITQCWDHESVCQVLLQSGTVLAIDTANGTVEERNRTLCKIVRIYQKHARLSRTALSDPTLIWPLYPDAIALVLFPEYKPEDIIVAARQPAFLPPGISRHIIYGRALKVNYPLSNLLHSANSVEALNDELQAWIRQKFAERSVRYYAESTYQFDE